MEIANLRSPLSSPLSAPPMCDERVTYMNRVVTCICHECNTPFRALKCPKCQAADTLPPSLVKFGEIVRSDAP